ncbi:MAG TPA: SAM-dependent chlorinase/fluorinase [Bacteroidota bacterium]|jgi:S-adenosylmethionine hydrolase|nr:SAM-dependent chlorinase/fluorinase [Bacteroidota bacterium]
MNKHPIIALLTDFGTADHYVASMKAVILSIAPNSVIIDLSHDVPPQDVDAAAYLLWSAHAWFPAGTIFVCVVDPGVGTRRPIICLRTKYTFIAPDNGLLKYVLPASGRPRIIAVTNRTYALKTISRTFHGRDIFAPAAAHLASGVSHEQLGKRVTPLHAPERFVLVSGTTSSGKVLHVDRFGNIITNLLCRNLPNNAVLKIGRARIHRAFRTYGEAGGSQPFMTIGSSGLLEISIRNGSAARTLKAHSGDPVLLARS